MAALGIRSVQDQLGLYIVCPVLFSKDLLLIIWGCNCLSVMGYIEESHSFQSSDYLGCKSQDVFVLIL